MCMSEHEGFCLPVIEAMHFGLPVVAFDASALTDTVGAGGILVKEKKHPELAELIAKLCEDQSFRQSLIDSGHRRVEEISFKRFEEQVRSLFGS